MAQSGAPFVFFLSKNPVLRRTGLSSLSLSPSLFIDNEQRPTTNDRSSIPTQNTGPESRTQISLESSLDQAKSNRSETTDRSRSKGLPYGTLLLSQSTTSNNMPSSLTATDREGSVKRQKTSGGNEKDASEMPSKEHHHHHHQQQHYQQHYQQQQQQRRRRPGQRNITTIPTPLSRGIATAFSSSAADGPKELAKNTGFATWPPDVICPQEARMKAEGPGHRWAIPLREHECKWSGSMHACHHQGHTFREYRTDSFGPWPTRNTPGRSR